MVGGEQGELSTSNLNSVRYAMHVGQRQIEEDSSSCATCRNKDFWSDALQFFKNFRQRCGHLRGLGGGVLRLPVLDDVRDIEVFPLQPNVPTHPGPQLLAGLADEPQTLLLFLPAGALSENGEVTRDRAGRFDPHLERT